MRVITCDLDAVLDIVSPVSDYRFKPDEETPNFLVRFCTGCWNELFISREALFSSVPDNDHRPSKTI